MAPPQLVIDNAHPRKDGSYPIRIKVGSGSNLYLHTGVYVFPENWDDNAQLYLSTTIEGQRINNILRAQLATVSARMYELQLSGQLRSLTRAQIRALIEDNDKSVADVIAETSDGNVVKMFERIIATKRGSTAQLYQNTLKKLKRLYNTCRLTFEDITPLWLREFESKLAAEGLRPNAISIDMRNLRAVVNLAIDEGITDVYGFRRYKIPHEDTEKRWLPLEDMRRFIAMDGMDYYCTMYRDLFLLMFLLMGINISDLAELTAASIRDGRLHYRRNKTGRLFSIKIEPEAAAIIEKYRGTRLLLAPFEKHTSYRILNQKLNQGLRRIGPLVPRPENDRGRGKAPIIMEPINTQVTSYWARHSWATYAAMLDIPRDTISEALGHSYGCAVTGIYIDFDRRKVDEANRRVIDFVLYGKK